MPEQLVTGHWMGLLPHHGSGQSRKGTHCCLTHTCTLQPGEGGGGWRVMLDPAHCQIGLAKLIGLDR